MQWYEKIRNLENPQSALQLGQETAIINSIGGIQMNDSETLQAILSEIKEIKQDVSGLRTDVSGLKTDVSGLKTDVSGLKTDVSGLKTDVSGLKTDVSELKTDVSGLKQHVSSMEEKQNTLENAILKINLTLENETNKKIGLMYESHQDILDKLKKTAQIDVTQNRVSVLEGVVKKHSDDIRELKTKIG